MRRLRCDAIVFFVFVVLAGLITYPQFAAFSTSVPFHSDPYFSMWRLGWVAHALAHQPGALFQGNIFYPEPYTLAYSDAMLLPGVLLAPLFWIGINPVVIYNGALIVALTLSAYTAFLLGRRLTANTAAGMVAGVIFAFAPYRFDHYSHLELQIVFWLPLALLAIHRLVDEARIRDGLWLGTTIAAQALSCMYAAIFLVTYCALFVPFLAMARAVRRARSFFISLAVGAALALAIVTPYALVYARAENTVGARSIDDVAHYSASPGNYLAAPPSNRLYGSVTSRFGSDELYLFPGFVAIVLGVMGVIGSSDRVRFVYLAALLLVFDMSRGVHGVSYPLLFHLAPFRALRSAARVGILVNLSLAILSAYGMAWVLGKIRRFPWQAATAIVIVAALATEYASSPVLARAPAPTAVDRWLARQSPAVVLQLPMTLDWLYMYQGIGHGQRMLNGYSGYPPDSYYVTRETMRSFPDERSIAYLQERHVDYVVVRGEHYRPADRDALLAAIEQRTDLSLVLRVPQGGSQDSVYAVGKPLLR